MNIVNLIRTTLITSLHFCCLFTRIEWKRVQKKKSVFERRLYDKEMRVKKIDKDKR